MKKKMLFFAVLLATFLFIPNALAVNIKGCEAAIPGVLIDVKIPNTVHTIIVVIKIAVPVLLIIFGMLDLGKAVVASKEDEIKKGQNIFIKRLIAAAIVFFVISVVQMLISFAAGEGEGKNIMDCANCFINGANEKTGKCN